MKIPVKVPKIKLSYIWKFLRQQWPITLFLAAIAFVGVVAVYKVVFTPSVYVYAQVKVSQGFWWASTQKPALWLAQSIRPGTTEYSLTGKPNAEVVEVRNYPWLGSDQYEVYMLVKLKVTKNERTGVYNFKRNALGVGTPVDFDFSDVIVSGTVMRLSDELITNAFVEKTITVEKNFAYTWEYNAIQIGDTYFDGKDTVFEIIDKKASPTAYLTQDSRKQYPGSTDARNHVRVTAKVKGMVENGSFVYAFEQVLKSGRIVNITTNNFVFTDYMLVSIQ